MLGFFTPFCPHVALKYFDFSGDCNAIRGKIPFYFVRSPFNKECLRTIFSHKAKLMTLLPNVLHEKPKNRDNLNNEVYFSYCEEQENKRPSVFVERSLS